MFPSCFNTTLNLTLLATMLFLCQRTEAQTSYISDFVDPNFVLAKEFPFHTYQAEVTIVKWARQFSLKGPWSVVDKPFAPPSGDKHDYLSWSPYSWPDCSNVGNTSVLPDEQVWTTCPYTLRDGEFNPDVRLINDVGNIDDLSNAVLYNSIAYVITGGNSNLFSRNAVHFLKIWFLDQDTRMNPSLTYAQILRGPDGQVGRHTGVLDMKGFVRIATAIEIFRKSNTTDWTPQIESGMIDWIKNYTSWIETDPAGLKEAAALNNHGTFYHVQLASLKLIVNDHEGAKDAIERYYNGQFLTQIEENGEQPLEAARTRPYHYHAYNIAAIISLARIAQYIDPEYNVWNRTSLKGGTLKKAMDFALSLDPTETNEVESVIEMFPYVAAIGSVFGDSDGKYKKFLENGHPEYATDPHFLWNQPFVGGPTVTSAADKARMTRRISSSGALGLKVLRGKRWMLGLAFGVSFGAGIGL